MLIDFEGMALKEILICEILVRERNSCRKIKVLWDTEIRHMLQYLFLFGKLLVKSFGCGKRAFRRVYLSELTASTDNYLVERTIRLTLKSLNKTPKVEAKVNPYAFSESLTSYFYKKQP